MWIGDLSDHVYHRHRFSGRPGGSLAEELLFGPTEQGSSFWVTKWDAGKVASGQRMVREGRRNTNKIQICCFSWYKYSYLG